MLEPHYITPPGIAPPGMARDRHIDYEETGAGPTTIVLVPGSCSTGAAWRPVMTAWDGCFRCVTTSLPGYGGTIERRTANDTDIARGAEAMEEVIARAGGAVHLVGHSFGGLVSLAVALRGRVALRSLTLVEAPAVGILRPPAERQHFHAINAMTQTYFAEFSRGNAEAIATMIDFYGGPGTFAGWPPRVRDYAIATTPVNILDWASAYGFELSAQALAAVGVPALIICGGDSHPAVRRANELLSTGLRDAAFATLDNAAHFSIATHPKLVARLIAHHVREADRAA